MNASLWILVFAAMGATASARAQHVKGDEAVRVLADGTKPLETAPLPRTGPIVGKKPCRAGGGCHPGPWRILEAPAGLAECTEPYARDGTCRPSTYGAKKASRLWVVRSGPTWLRCQYPDPKCRCGEIFARPPTNLPLPALQ